MRYQYRFNKKERARLAVLESILADKAITPSERLAALRAIERLESAARRRAEEREWNPPEPAEPAEPTVDQLVADLEKAQKPTLTIQQVTDPKNGENAVLEPPTAGKALEVTQTVLEPTTVFCAFCSAAGPWNTRYPVGQEDGLLLCPACFSKMCASGMRQASAAAKAAAETPQDWAEPFNAQRKTFTSDYQRSVEIWQQQDREAADRQEQDRIERERAEVAYHSARARWIQDGGRL